MEELKIENLSLGEKLVNIQADLQDLKLKKSGKNTFNHFEYFELSDFLPSIVRLCKKFKVLTYISFTQDKGILTAVNGNNLQEQISVESPLVSIEMKGANAIQALGAVETYTRRYLYLAMFNITEPDTFDYECGKDDKKPTQKPTQVKKPIAKPQPKIEGGADDYLASQGIEQVIEQAQTLSGNKQRLLEQDDKWVDYTLKKANVKSVADIPEAMVVSMLDYLAKKGELK